MLAIKQPEVVKYFTDPDAIDPPDMELLFPFVESALPLAYGVLGVQLFHVREISTIFINLVKLDSFPQDSSYVALYLLNFMHLCA